MDYKNLFKKFNIDDQLLLPDTTIPFKDIPWSKHLTFEGVELKHITTAKQTNGQFSFHLVRISPNKKLAIMFIRNSWKHTKLFPVREFVSTMVLN